MPKGYPNPKPVEVPDPRATDEAITGSPRSVDWGANWAPGTPFPMPIDVNRPKQHYGRIENWHRIYFDPRSASYCIFGFSFDHKRLAGHLMTSVVISHDEATGEIETVNGKYRLVGPEEP